MTKKTDKKIISSEINVDLPLGSPMETLSKDGEIKTSSLETEPQKKSAQKPAQNSPQEPDAKAPEPKTKPQPQAKTKDKPEEKSKVKEKSSQKNKPSAKIAEDISVSVGHTKNTTVSSEEVENFNNYKGSWWDENGPFKPIHALNPVRIQFIKDRIIRMLGEKDAEYPLKDLKIADIGCGAGIATEPLARLGANMTGVDASDSAISQARAHAKEHALDIDYRLSSIEALSEEGHQFDVVMALEIIEHVDHPELFVELLCKILKPGGLLFMSTLNRTWMSYAKGILAAEFILKWVPQGTHQWEKFVKPSEISQYLRTSGLCLSDIKGIDYSILRREWKLVHDVSTNYIVCATHI